LGTFDGVIVNFTGDGLITAFDGQSISIAACDAAVHAASVMVAVVYTLEFPRFSGHLIAASSGVAGRMFVHVIKSWREEGIPA
jgi:protoporphyrinogen oxidase